MPQKAASAKSPKAAKPKPYLASDYKPPEKKPLDKETSHDCDSYSICNFSIELQTGVQGVSLCIHNDFTIPDSPIAVHLGHGSVTLGKPPPADTAQHVYDIRPFSVLNEEDLCEEGEKEEQANKEKENQLLARNGRQHDTRVGLTKSRRKWWRVRHTSLFLTPTARPDVGPRRRGLGFPSTILALALFVIFFLAPNRTQPEPESVPEYTLIKPLVPSPEVSFTKLLQRHAMAPFAIVQSDATDTNIYRDLLWNVDKYCEELRLRLVADWVCTLPTTNEQQWWSWFTHEYNDAAFHGPAYEHAMVLCDEFHTILHPLAPEVVVPLHAFVVNYWGVHAVTAMLSAASSLATFFPTQNDSTLLLDSPKASTMSLLGNDNLATNRTLNASLSITVLKELSNQVTLPREWSEPAIVNIRTLNTSIDKVVTLGEALLEPTWEQWLAQNGPPGHDTQDKAEKVLRKDLEHLSRLRNQAHSTLSVLKSVQGRFSGPATEALDITGSDVDKLKDWMDNLIAGKGWTQLVQDEEEKWILDWYYFPLRPDLPDWMNRQAQIITDQLKELAHK